MAAAVVGPFVCECEISAWREIEGTLEGIFISLAVPVCKANQCGPAEIPRNIFHMSANAPWRD